ncbi:MAG: calcium/sodium antiporter [Bacteroidales bacterium]|nr:calcium/sodium antiporter [Bacteroidales bacterium]
MLSTLLLLAAGLLLVVFGADWLVDGASSIARKLKISEFVIGLTIVGFGTSCPELVVSVTGAVEGISDIAVGNVIGSNVFNTLLILGLTALIMPIAITRNNKRRDIPVTLLVTFLLVFCGMSKTLLNLGLADGLSRVEGIVFLLLFGIYIFWCFKHDEGIKEEEDKAGKTSALWLAILLSAGGIAALIFGGQLFVDNAVNIAKALGVSDKFIAITLLAGGTSMPELAACIVAAIKKKGQLALGNILGSNIFNILLILGTSAVIRPISFSGLNLVDVLVLLLSIILVWLSSYTFVKNKIDRYEGAVFVLTFIAYYIWLFIKL